MFALTLCLALPAPPEPDAHPNVVLIVADDLGWGDVGWHAADMPTPNLDRLVGEGVEFDQHYVMPQCTPTRVALMSGRYPSRFSKHCTTASNERSLPPGTPTLASLLQGAGYRTGLIGKWHLGSDPAWGPGQYGFDTSYGSLTGAVGMYDHRYRLGNQYELTWQRDGALLELGTPEDEGHATDLCLREALAFLQVEDPAPFFLYLPFHAVHTPLVESELWLERAAHIEDEERQLYAAAVAHLDHAIGRITRALVEQELASETLVIFVSDNGAQINHSGGQYPPPDPALSDFSSNAPLRGRKTQAYEGGVRVPAFAWWPGRLAPRVSASPLHAVDWLPTLARLCGVELAPEFEHELDGVDMGPWLFGDSEPPIARERPMYWVWGGNRRWEALRAGAHKIVRQRNQAWELYDLANDPNETTDLAAEQTEILARLLAHYTLERSRDAFD